MNLRNLFFIVGFVCLTSLMTEAKETSQGLMEMKVLQQSQQDTLIYTVYGMDCPGCEGGLEKQVNKIPAVKESNAFWMKQELIVITKKDSVLDIEDLKKRVKKANFTLDIEKKVKEK